jgi:hypothetical protein
MVNQIPSIAVAREEQCVSREAIALDDNQTPRRSPSGILPDSSNLVHTIQSTEFDLFLKGVLYRDIRAFIRLNFSSVNVMYCPRSRNKVAHVIKTIGNNEERKEITARRHKILTWKTLFNKEK